jgi:hypothetical protein
LQLHCTTTRSGVSSADQIIGPPGWRATTGDISAELPLRITLTCVHVATESARANRSVGPHVCGELHAGRDSEADDESKLIGHDRMCDPSGLHGVHGEPVLVRALPTWFLAIEPVTPAAKPAALIGAVI